MRTFITTTLILFILTEVWMADAASLVQRKKRGWIVESLPLSFTLEEELDRVFPYVLGKVNVEKSLTCSLSGPGATEEPMGIFHLNDGLGVIEVNGKVDYEKNKKFMLSLECSNSEKVQSRTEVEIRVLDINDNPPLFEEVSYEVSVEESTPQGTDLVTDLRVVDQDDSSTGNGLFSFSIISVFPESPNIEFFITQQGRTGQISFRGCLDYEEARKYIILVEAKDHGEDVQLSSMATVEVNIIDSNNHKPELSNTTGSGRVKERENGVVVYRLEVEDKDHRGSAAWRAKYTLHGDKEKNFKVETDPTTNQGIVSVVTPLDFEESPEVTLQVSVENEEPLFSCQVKQRRDNILWDVEYFRGTSTSALLSFPITITVEDVNDPPELTPPVKHVTVIENTSAGQSLCMLTATDQDRDSPAGFRFYKGEDVDHWVTVNSETGEVTTVKVLDRESPFVTDSTYAVTVYAVDRGEPPLTGTGTLVIHLLDQNDNLPQLEVNTLSMCLSDGVTRADITAVDADLPPFSGPFKYELLGDMKDQWRIEPSFGTTVSLVMDSSVNSGRYDLRVKITDSQGAFSVQLLTVSVNNCKPGARVGKSPTVRLGVTAIGVIAVSVLLGVLLAMFSMYCACKAKKPMMDMQSSECSLVKYNDEAPGTDCDTHTISIFRNLSEATKINSRIRA